MKLKDVPVGAAFKFDNVKHTVYVRLAHGRWTHEYNPDAIAVLAIDTPDKHSGWEICWDYPNAQVTLYTGEVK